MDIGVARDNNIEVIWLNIILNSLIYIIVVHYINPIRID
jgi:hypothetical protein